MVLNYDRAELKDIELVDDGCSYYLDVTYEYENKYGIYELHIPRVCLPLITDTLPACEIDIGYHENSQVLIDLGFGKLEALKDFKTNMTHKITEIKKKTQKMTLAEIEAALGYKIELVSE